MYCALGSRPRTDPALEPKVVGNGEPPIEMYTKAAGTTMSAAIPSPMARGRSCGRTRTSAPEGLRRQTSRRSALATASSSAPSGRTRTLAAKSAREIGARPGSRRSPMAATMPASDRTMNSGTSMPESADHTSQ
jgi:hypothetical protein